MVCCERTIYIQLEYVLLFLNFQNWFIYGNRELIHVMKSQGSNNSPISKSESLMTKCELVSFCWDKAAQSVKARLTPGCAERRGNKGALCCHKCFQENSDVQYLPPFLVTQFTRRHYNAWFSIPPPTFWSQKEALLCLPAKIGHQYHWHGLGKNAIQKFKLAKPEDLLVCKQRREKVSNTEGVMIWPKLTTAMSLPSSFLCSYPATVVNAIRLTNLVILDFIQNRSKALPVKQNIYVPLHTLALVVDWLLCLVHSCLWISLKSALSAYVLWHNAHLSSFVCMQSAPQPTLHSLLALWRTMCSSRRWCPYDAHWSPLVCPGLGNSCSAHSHSSNSYSRPGGKVVLNRDPQTFWTFTNNKFSKVYGDPRT